MSSKSQRVLARFGVALASTLMTLLLVEVLFYLYFPQPTCAIKFSPWGFEHIPNISFKHTTESKETISYITYNSEGFRGEAEFSVDKPADTLRVAILGDSYGEGAEVDYQYLHGTVLEQMLNEYLAAANGRYRRAEVIKAGVYAYESCQEMRLFEARVQKYRPDVVFVIYTGELDENQSFCRLVGEELEYIDMTYSWLQYVTRYVLGHLKAKSHFLNYVGRVGQYALGIYVHVPEQLNRTFAYEPPPMREFVAATPTVDYSIEHYLGVSDDPSIELPQGSTHRLLFAIFKRFGEQVSASGGKLFIGFSHTEEALQSPLARSVHRSGIGSLSLFSYVNDHRTQPAHLARDGHWNEYGHYLVGRAFFAVVRHHLGAAVVMDGTLD